MKGLRQNYGRDRVCLVLIILFSIVLFSVEAHSFTTVEPYDCNTPENRDKATTLELVVAKKKWRKKKKELKASVISENSALKVRVKLFPFLNPPMNIGIGSCVSAEEGRLGIRKAIELNGGLDHVIMQELLPHHWVKVGSTDLAELSWIRVSPKDLLRLSDPALSTKQFQNTYRELATLKERKLPFGLGTKKIDVEPEK
ncbi:MAG: hypothetical protein ABGX83_06825 [Nitrospira sp.]|nr:hypothetical protein [Candidatus Manganitrophaceae bacterium]HIL35290.1 hypothetical protein [Candidatus Manganitrophaceae bacterium]